MQETTFKLRMKKWSQSLSVINENTDKLNSTEQDAIKTLCNLWRREQFGQKCSESVERMVSNLLKNENAHGGNQLFLKEALKDFRSISKEFYTKDEETFRQFAAAAKEIMGGPQRTDEQQQRRKENDERRRKEAEQQQRQQAEEQRRREEEQRRKREEEQRRQQNNRQQNNQQNNRQQNNQQNNRQDNKWQSHQQNGKKLLWGGLAALVVVVLVVVGYFVKSSLDSSAAEEKQRRLAAMTLLLKGVWNGELEDRKAELSIDSLKKDSVFGQVRVKQRRKTETHAVSGTARLVDNTLLLSLTDHPDADAKSPFLNGNYELTFDKKEKTLTGKHTSLDAQQSLDILFTQSGASVSTKKSASKDSKTERKKSSDTKQQSAKQSATSSSKVQNKPAPQTQEEPVQQNKGTGFKLERTVPQAQEEPVQQNKGTGFKLEKVNKEDVSF